MSKTVTWNYKGDADVVFGEIHISKAPKIILAITVITVIAACVTGFLLRDFIYDALTNPQIMLKNVSQDDTGFFVEIPYEQDSVEFTADSYIDTVNTREYESFINPEITAYSFTIDGNVDTSTIGEYKVTYTSRNRVKKNYTDLIVRVKDITSPVITLKDPQTGKELAKTTDGVYYGVSLHRNTDEINNWKAEDYVMSITDNYTETNNINIEYPEKPNFNSSTEDNITVTYVATDASGNRSETNLKIMLVKQNSTIGDLTALTDKKEREQQLVEQTTRDDNTGNNNNNNDNNNGNNNNGNNDGTNHNHRNDDGTTPIMPTGEPSLTANPFTWSVSSQGTLDVMIMNAIRYVEYYDYSGGTAWPTGGVGITFQPEGPGTYELYWTSSSGLTATQYITITE